MLGQAHANASGAGFGGEVAALGERIGDPGLARLVDAMVEYLARSGRKLGDGLLDARVLAAGTADTHVDLDHLGRRARIDIETRDPGVALFDQRAVDLRVVEAEGLQRRRHLLCRTPVHSFHQGVAGIGARHQALQLQRRRHRLLHLAGDAGDEYAHALLAAVPRRIGRRRRLLTAAAPQGCAATQQQGGAEQQQRPQRVPDADGMAMRRKGLHMRGNIARLRRTLC